MCPAPCSLLAPSAAHRWMCRSLETATWGWEMMELKSEQRQMLTSLAWALQPASLELLEQTQGEQTNVLRAFGGFSSSAAHSWSCWDRARVSGWSGFGCSSALRLAPLELLGRAEGEEACSHVSAWHYA